MQPHHSGSRTRGVGQVSAPPVSSAIEVWPPQATDTMPDFGHVVLLGFHRI